MKLVEAIPEMLRGKKISLAEGRNWYRVYLYISKDGLIRDEDDLPYSPYGEDWASEWEIYEENIYKNPKTDALDVLADILQAAILEYKQSKAEEEKNERISNSRC